MPHSDAHPDPVLIAGGGPVGLCAALELARFGIQSVIIEQREGTSDHPKTRVLNSRTMEIAQGWGEQVVKGLRSIDCPPAWKSPIRMLDSVAGRQLFALPTLGFVGPGEQVTPVSPVLSSQDRFEPILLDAAAASPLVTLMYGYRIESLSRGGEPDATDAAVVVSDTCSGATSTLVGSAVVAADGADSFIRRSLGVAQDGVRGVAHFLNFYFRADIEPHVRDRPANFYLIANDALLGAIQPLDIKGRWLCQIEVATDRESREKITPERATDWIRRACGLPDLKIEILAITRWRMNATMAQRFTQGRVILCGDAAQQLPPTGGLGVNTGIQGLHNAMWKLAYVLTGKADMSLIHTYDTERRQPTRWVIEQSLDNFHSVRAIGAKMRAGTAYGKDPTALSMTIRRWGNQLGAEFGTVYSSGAIVPDGTAPPQADDLYSDYLPSATPGCRAPHVWLGTDDIQISTLDLVRPSLTLLAADNGRGWVEAAIQASARTGVRIAYYRLGCPGLEDPGGRFRELYGLARDGAVLIRPDGYVAWRSPTGSADAVNELADVVATILNPDLPHR